MIGTGHTDRYLTDDETRAIVRDALASLPVDGRRVLFIIPDGTRTMPMPMLFGLFREALGPRVAALDYLVALGTHQPMDDAALSRLVGEPVVAGRAGTSRIHNHEWHDPAMFAHLGVIPAAEIGALTGGRLAQDVPVSLNRRMLRLRPGRHLRARCSRTRWSASPAATSTSSPASPARRSSTSSTGSAR